MPQPRRITSRDWPDKGVFRQVSINDPECAMAYCGAAMTYNHPFWDALSTADETSAWGLVQEGLAAKKVSPREKLYLAAVAALFKDAGAGSDECGRLNRRPKVAPVSYRRSPYPCRYPPSYDSRYVCL
jgi:hypothetical protein